MHKRTVSVPGMIIAATIGVASIFVMPQNAAAQGGPAGSYRNSCRSISMARGGYLQAQCRTVSGAWRQSRIRVSDCKGRDIANSNGRLICAEGRRGKNDRRDRDPWYGKHDDRNRRDNDRRDRDRRDDRYDRNRGSRPSQSGLVLFSGTRWSGRSMTFRGDNMNLERTGFNDVATSIRIVGPGTWRVCSNKNYSGRCVNVSNDIRDLNSIGLRNAISSIRRIR